MDYSGSYISPYTEHPGMEQPVLYWTPSIAPAGLAYYDGMAFPDWQGDLFVAALVEQSVRRVDLEDARRSVRRYCSRNSACACAMYALVRTATCTC